MTALRCADCMLERCDCSGRGSEQHGGTLAETVINGTALCAHCAKKKTCRQAPSAAATPGRSRQ